MIAVSSPGRMRNFSPTCRIPLHTRPVTAVPDDGLLYTFEIGKRTGAVKSLEGGSRRSKVIQLGLLRIRKDWTVT